MPAARFCSAATALMKIRPRERGQAAKLEREREHPLAHGHRRQDAVDDAGAGVGHAPPGAARADAAALAGEGDEEVALTGVAVKTEESVGEYSAREVGAEGLLDVARQAAFIALAGVGEERFEVVAHDRVEDRLRRPARGVVVLGRAPSPRRLALRHRPGGLAIGVPQAASVISNTWRGRQVAAAVSAMAAPALLETGKGRPVPDDVKVYVGE
jgi:hypothetical protein